MTAWRYGVSVGVSPREPLAEFAKSVTEMERAGFAKVWIIDSQLAMKDVYVAMAVAAMATERLGIGTGVTNLFTRHPTVTANAILSIDELSGGRAMLGLGAGATAADGARLARGTVAQVAAGVPMLRDLMLGREVSTEGGTARLATGGRQVPIYIAASQPKMLEMAAQVADGIILMGAADRGFVDWQMRYVARGLEAVGRSRDQLAVDLVVTMSCDADSELALDDVRAWAASQASSFADWRQLPPGYDEFRDDYSRARQAYDIVEHLSVHARHRAVVGDGFTQKVAIAGDVSYCISRLRALRGCGIDGVILALLPRGRRRRVAEFAKDIAPMLEETSPGIESA